MIILCWQYSLTNLLIFFSSLVVFLSITEHIAYSLKAFLWCHRFLYWQSYLKSNFLPTFKQKRPRLFHMPWLLIKKWLLSWYNASRKLESMTGGWAASYYCTQSEPGSRDFWKLRVCETLVSYTGELHIATYQHNKDIYLISSFLINPISWVCIICICLNHSAIAAHNI